MIQFGVTLARLLVAGALLALTACGGGGVRVRTDVPEPAVSPPLQRPATGRLAHLPPQSQPEGLVVDALTHTIAVGVRNPDGVLILDATTLAVRRRLDLAGAPRHLQLARPGVLLVPSEGNDRLSTIDLASGALTAQFPVGRQPHDAAAAGGSYYVGDELADTVHVIGPNGASTVVVGPRQPGGVAAGIDGQAVMVVGVRGRRVEQIDPGGRVVGSAACGVGPTHVRAGPGGLFYVADTQGDAVLVYRAGRNGPVLVGHVHTGGTPYGLAVDPARHLLYVTLTTTNQLVVLRLSGTSAVIQRVVPVSRQPNDVAVDESTGGVIVAGTADGVLDILDAPVGGER